LKQHNDLLALKLSKSHRAFDVSAKRFGLIDVAGRQSDAEKSGTNAYVTSPLRGIGGQRLKRRDIGVAGLHVLFMRADRRVQDKRRAEQTAADDRR
jgi:hypothetical protein